MGRMLNRMLRHLTYANVMTTVLLFIVLGGGAYAVSSKNSITSEDIKNGEIKTADLDNGAVTGKKVDNDSLGAEDIDSQIAHPSGSTDVSTGAPGTPVPYPLTGNTWTQPAGEMELITGTITYTTPASCVLFGNPESFGNGIARAKLGANGVVSAYLVAIPASTERTGTFVLDPLSTPGFAPYFLRPQESDAERTLTMEIEDECAGAGSSDDFVVHSVDIDVFGVD